MIITTHEDIQYPLLILWFYFFLGQHHGFNLLWKLGEFYMVAELLCARTLDNSIYKSIKKQKYCSYCGKILKFDIVKEQNMTVWQLLLNRDTVPVLTDDKSYSNW